jgi:hypothetical protein
MIIATRRELSLRPEAVRETKKLLARSDSHSIMRSPTFLHPEDKAFAQHLVHRSCTAVHVRSVTAFSCCALLATDRKCLAHNAQLCVK